MCTRSSEMSFVSESLLRSCHGLPSIYDDHVSWYSRRASDKEGGLTLNAD